MLSGKCKSNGIKCDICTQLFPTEEDLKKHIENVHNEEKDLKRKNHSLSPSTSPQRKKPFTEDASKDMEIDMIELIEDMIDNIDFKIYKESEEMSAKELKYWRNAK